MFPDIFDVIRDFDRHFRRTLPAGTTGQALTTERDRWPSLHWEGIYPAVDCFTRDNQLILKAELPGVNPDEVEVSLTGNRLTIRGVKKTELKTDKENLLIHEISHGRFERSFTVPEGIKPDDVKASYDHGVLELSMPAEGVEVSRKIPIEASASGKSLTAA